MKTLLGDFPVATFLERHWQKSPLFLPGAVRGLSSPLDTEELLGLACEEDVESRLVTHDAARPWRLRHGPFEARDFAVLDGQTWTLLVQDVDKHVPPVSDLLRLVDFLPRWSVDDVMISVAADGGSVGPHVDQYDVFLVQVEGTREWQLSERVDPDDVRDDTELRVLRTFEPQQTFRAEPGDVLYLPAGVAHFGVAQGHAMTYSFGFRPPSLAELAEELAAALRAKRDPRRVPIRVTRGRHAAQLSPELVEDVTKLLHAELGSGDLEGWLGRMLTTPKPSLEAALAAAEAPLDGADLRERVVAGSTLVRDPLCRWLFSRSGAGDVVVFFHGESRSLGRSPGAERLAQRLCSSDPLTSETLDEWREDNGVWEWLAELYARGYLSLDGDPE